MVGVTKKTCSKNLLKYEIRALRVKFSQTVPKQQRSQIGFENTNFRSWQKPDKPTLASPEASYYVFNCHQASSVRGSLTYLVKKTNRSQSWFYFHPALAIFFRYLEKNSEIWKLEPRIKFRKLQQQRNLATLEGWNKRSVRHWPSEIKGHYQSVDQSG